MPKLPKTISDLSALWRALKLRQSSWSRDITIPDQPAYDPEFDDRFQLACALASTFYIKKAAADAALYIGDYVGGSHYKQVDYF